MRKLVSGHSTNASRQAFAVVFAGALILSAGAPAGAQSFIEIDSVPTVLGVGLGVVPDYQGSDDYTAGIAPILRYTFAGQERYVQLLANELTLNLVNSRKYRFGPVINYRFGRDDDVEDDRVKRMRELDGTVEAGVFGDIAWIDENNPRNRFLLGATLLQDIGDESDGFKARLSARGWQQVGRAVDINLGAGFVYADDDYTDHYFGVNANNVGSSGLPFFSADGGGQEYFLTAGAIVYLSKQWLLGAGVRYSNLIGDAADSPIVEDRGTRPSGLAVSGLRICGAKT